MTDPDVQNSKESRQPSRSIWQRSVFVPGLAVIGLVVLGRLLGLFQSLEWKTLDSFLRWRPAEPQDKRVLVVGIDEADLQSLDTYPVPDATLAALVQTLAQHQPRAIGIDIVRNFPVPPGHQELVTTLTALPNVYGIEKISDPWVLPPPSLPPERVGFIDFPLDADGFIRRTYLGAYPAPGYPRGEKFRFSLALQMAKTYLAQDGINLENGRQNRANMSFGQRELFQMQPNTGGYVAMTPQDVQVLINVRSGPAPFQIVSMADVMAGRLRPEDIRDRVVLIGLTAISVKDLVNSAAVASDNPGLVNGVELHAHVVSQILSHVLDGRPMVRSWGDGWEYLWIVAWGTVGILLVRRLDRPSLYMAAVGLIGVILVGSSFVLLWLGGWWLPLVPTLLVFMVNGIVLPGFYLFYLYDQTLQLRLRERQWLIEHTYDTIHNGPLQTLALLLKEKATLPLDTSTRLETLNRELREVHNRLMQGTLSEAEQVQIGSQHIIDLRHPFDEVLYEVYAETLRRTFPGFSSIKFQVIKFEPLRVEDLSTDDKRALCRFLEEALCNIGKHAAEPTRLTILCLATDTENLIHIEDNGKTLPGSTQTDLGGRGTQQAQDLARRLGGTFQRIHLLQGTRCELRWPLPSPRPWWRF